MIEVIKHGQKKFKAICTKCGCEFTYELSDILLGGVDCPDCGNHVTHQGFGNNNGGLYYPPNCRGVEYLPKTMLFDSETATASNKADVVGTLYGTQGDVYTTEKDLEIQQMFKDKMDKKEAIPCAGLEYCNDCPYFNWENRSCSDELKLDALNLITEQENEIEYRKKQYDNQVSENTQLYIEYDKLKDDYAKLQEQFAQYQMASDKEITAQVKQAQIEVLNELKEKNSRTYGRP